MAPTMQALLLTRHDDSVRQAIAGLQVVTRPRPAPARGQVLVRMAAAPCNPSDLLFLQNRYGAFKSLPSVPGWEGAGTVVGCGGGWLARGLIGKRVACSLQSDRDGTWAEYFVANAWECVPLLPSVTLEQGASLIINPMTALALLHEARRGRHPAAVQTGAAGQLGRMLLAISRRMGYPMIHIVRRAEQVELLKSLGAEEVLNSSDEDFPQQLRLRAKYWNATVAFDAVAGEMTGKLLAALPPSAKVYLYGALAESASSSIDPIEIIFHGRTVTGFYLADWLRRRPFLSVIRLAFQVQRMIAKGTLQTEICRRVGLHQAVDALLHYQENMTAGKILICP